MLPALPEVSNAEAGRVDVGRLTAVMDRMVTPPHAPPVVRASRCVTLKGRTIHGMREHACVFNPFPSLFLLESNRIWYASLTLP